MSFFNNSFLFFSDINNIADLSFFDWWRYWKSACTVVSDQLLSAVINKCSLSISVTSSIIKIHCGRATSIKIVGTIAV